MSVLKNNRYDFQNEPFTLAQFLEFNNLPENSETRFEMIDGFVYAMAAPRPVHARIAMFIISKLYPYLQGKRCEPFTDVDIYFKTKTGTDVLRPDIFVNCDPNRVKETHCDSCPEFIVEVVSPSSYKDDYHFKKNYYIENGAKEYWIVDHYKEMVTVATQENISIYSFADTVKVGALEDLSIDFSELVGILARASN